MSRFTVDDRIAECASRLYKLLREKAKDADLTPTQARVLELLEDGSEPSSQSVQSQALDARQLSGGSETEDNEPEPRGRATEEEHREMEAWLDARENRPGLLGRRMKWARDGDLAADMDARSRGKHKVRDRAAGGGGADAKQWEGEGQTLGS